MTKFKSLLIFLIVGIILTTSFNMHRILVSIFNNSVSYNLEVIDTDEDRFDEAIYAALFNKSSSTFLFSDSYLYEKNDFKIYPNFLNFTLGKISIWFDKIDEVIIYMSLLSTFFTILLLITFLKNSSSVANIHIIILFFTGYMLWYYFPSPIIIEKIKALLNGDYLLLGYLGRFPIMQMSIVYLLLSLYLFIQITRKKFHIWQLITFGVFFSLSYYIYFFYWTAISLSILLAFIFNALIIKKYNIAKNYLITGITTVIFSLPFWINYLIYIRSDIYEDLNSRMGIEIGRTINVTGSVKYIVVIFIIEFLLRRYSFRNEFKIYLRCFYYFLISGIFFLNIQIITGYNVQSYHWNLTILAPVSLLAALLLLNESINQKKIPAVFSVLISASMLFFSLYNGYLYAKHKSAKMRIDTPTIELISYLKEEIPQNAVVATLDPRLNMLLPAYTKSDQFLPSVHYTMASTDEIYLRILSLANVLNIPESNLKFLFNYNRNRLTKAHYENLDFYITQCCKMFNYVNFHHKYKYYKDYFRYYEELDSEMRHLLKTQNIRVIPEQKVSFWMNKYSDMHTTQLTYKLDYLIIGRFEEFLGSKSTGKVIFSNSTYQVLKFQE